MGEVSFSVIVPVYQAEKYLERCLNSLSKQSYLNFEVIMIDDGSKDSSYSICCKFQKQDKRFLVIHQENQGVSTARNVGLKLAKKDYVVFVDADDYVVNNYLGNLNHVLEKEDICFSTKYYEVMDSKVKLVEERPYNICCKWKEGQKFFEEFSKGKWIPPFGVLNNCYRREFLLEHNIWFNPTYTQAEDADFVFQACLYFKKGTWLEQACYYYRKDNQNSTTYKMDEKGLRSVLAVYEKWYHFCIKKNGKAYKNWAEYFSKLGNSYLVLGSQLKKSERKKIFSKTRKSQEFYRGNTHIVKRIILDIYCIFGYENVVPLIAVLSKLKIKLRECYFSIYKREK